MMREVRLQEKEKSAEKIGTKSDYAATVSNFRFVIGQLMSIASADSNITTVADKCGEPKKYSNMASVIACTP